MKLPWDKSYFKLCFYIIFTFMVIYVFKNVIDIIVYALMNMGGIYRGIIKGTSSVISVFSAIIIGFIIAYVLNPMVDFFEKHRLKRWFSVTIVYVIFLFAITGVVFVFILNITECFNYSVIDGLERQFYIFQENLDKIINFLNRYNIDLLDQYKKLEFNDEEFYSAASLFGRIFLGLIISIYFLKDKENIINNLKRYFYLLSDRVTKPVMYVLRSLNKSFSGYVRGQLSDAVIMSAIASLAASIIDIPFAIPIGILSGFINIIPYFGGIFSFIVAVGITVLSGNYAKAVYIAIALFVIQQLDSVFVSPKIVGKSTKLSPVSVIIAIAVASNMFGIWGMILAVPMLSFFKIVLNDMIEKYN